MPRKRKRTYEEVTNGVSKKAIVPSPPTKRPVGERNSLDLGSSGTGNDICVERSDLRADEQVYETQDCTDSGSCLRSSEDDVSRDGQQLRDIRLYNSPRCDSLESGLFAAAAGGQEVDALGALGDGSEYEPGMAEIADRYTSDEDVLGEGHEPELLFRQQFDIYPYRDIPSVREMSNTGMTANDCIHAMRILARFMDVCVSMSDYPNADIPEIVECLEAFVDTFAEIVNLYYAALDKLDNPGG